jgi:hypothetical protein
MKNDNFNKYLSLLTLLLISAISAAAQTTAFNYQGKLTDAGAPQATYQMQFKLFDAPTGGSQIGATIENPSVAVTDGVFSVSLSFGANAFPGADRFLEIGVRRSAGESYTILNPRQQIASSPYSIRTLSAQTADVSLDSQKLGGVAASEYVTNSTVGSSVIRNGTTQQTANLNISGNGFFGGSVGIGTTAANPNFRFETFGTARVFNSVAAHVVAETTGGTNSWARFYMRSPNRSWFMGTSQNFNADQFYLVDETAGQTRMAISTAGFVGFGTTSPQSGLELRGTGLGTQQRITDNTSGNSLVLQSGAGSSMKITGFNYNTSTAVPLYLSVDGANTVLNSGGGNVLQPGAGYGLPKAMVFVLANGTIARCYNAISGVSLTGGTTNSGCGFTAAAAAPNGTYNVNLGFDMTTRFFSVLTYGGSSNKGNYIPSISGNTVTVFTFLNDQGNLGGVVSDFFLIVY